MKKSLWFVSTVLVAGLVSIPFLLVHSTSRKMADYRTRIQPGMKVDDLVRAVGKPTRILHQGEVHWLVSHYGLDEHTVIYWYSKEGFPYYEVIVFADAERNVVTNCIVEKLGHADDKK